MPDSIYGILNVADTKNFLVSQNDEVLVFDAINMLLDRYNQDLAEAVRVFVDGDTTQHQIRYFQPGAGEMQEGTEFTRPGAVKSGQSYTVGFGLRDFRDQIAWNDISYAYATVQQLDLQVKTVMIRHRNTVRKHILKAIFNNAQYTFDDPQHGDVIVYPLANGDATLYPPTIGNQTPATANHYVASNMASITDGTNPLPTYRDLLLSRDSDANLYAFVNATTANQIRALLAFVDVADPNIRQFQGTEAVYNGPSVPGQVIGRVNDMWIVQWNQIPAGYVVVTDISKPAPLMRRLDAVEVPGRGQLTLVAQQQEHPVMSSFFRDRHGFGVGNRLNTVIGQVTGAAYVVPSAYA